MKNYEVNIYSYNEHNYLCVDNYFNTYEEAAHEFVRLEPTLLPGEELMLYERLCDDNGNEIENKILEAIFND